MPVEAVVVMILTTPTVVKVAEAEVELVDILLQTLEQLILVEEVVVLVQMEALVLVEPEVQES